MSNSNFLDVCPLYRILGESWRCRKL